MRVKAMFCGLLCTLCLSLQASAGDAPILQLDTGGHKATIKDVSFTPDGTYLVSAGDDKVVRIWDWRRGKVHRTIRGEIGSGNAGKNFAMAVSPNGKFVVTAGWMDADDAFEPCCGDIRIFELETGKLVDLLRGHDNIVYDLGFSPDGKFLISGGAGQVAILWDLKARKEVHRFGGHKRRINQVAFTTDGRRVVTASYDGDLVLWGVANKQPIARMRGHRTRIFALAVSPDGKLLASGDADGEIRLWDARSGASLKKLADQSVSIGSLAFSRDSKSLLSTCSYRCQNNNGQHVFDVASGRVRVVHKGHKGTVRASAISPNGHWAATAGGDNHEIQVWELRTGDVRRSLKGVGAVVWAVGISPDNIRLAWGNEDPCPDQTACPNALGRLAWQMGLPDRDRSIERPKALKEGAVDFIRARDRAGEWRLSAGPGGDFNRPGAVLELRQGDRPVGSLVRDDTDGFEHSAFTFTPDATWFVSGGDHGTLVAYRASDRSEVAAYTGHTGPITALAMSRDGRLLISGSADQTVRIWNAKTAELIVSLFRGLNGQWVMWTPQGYYDSSPDGDSLVGWQINQGAEREARYVTARQLKKHLHSPEIIRRAIILGSARQAVKELRGTDNELQRLLAHKPPRFKVISPADGASVDGGRVRIVLDFPDPDARAARIEVIANNRNVTPPTVRDLARSEHEQRGQSISVPLRQGRNTILITAYNELGYLTESVLELTSKSEGALDKKGRLFLIGIGVNKYPGLPPVCNGRSCDLRYAVADASEFVNMTRRTVAPLFKEVKTLLLVNGAVEPTSANITGKLEEFLSETTPEDMTILFLAGHGTNINERYFFLPTNASMKSNQQLRKSTLVRWDVLQEVLEDSKGTRLMFIDTCHAANAFNARLEKDAGDARIVVFSATKANSVSLEYPNLRHGVFTHALLSGLRGEADRSKDSAIKLLELGSYTSDTVEQITNGTQVPVFYFSGVDDFVFAQP